MAKLSNRSQLMAYFGAEQRNVVWSWCAVNETERKVYLSVWTDFHGDHAGNGRKSYIIQESHWGMDSGHNTKSASRNDHDEKLDKIFNQGYEAYGYFNRVKDPTARPREIEKTITSFIFSLELEKLHDGTIIGYQLDRINLT